MNKKQALRFTKKYWPLFVLGVILLLGLFFRLYHVSYPVVGYHNMKEAHTLMEARHFLEEGNLLENRRDYKIGLDNPEGVHSDNFPLYGWSIALIWKFTGVSLVAARGLTIVMALGIAAFTYLVTKELFRREDIGLLSAFMVAVLPISGFFGRMVFYDVPALLFAMAALYFFLLWKKDLKRKFLLMFVICITLAALTKLVYLVFLFPIAAVFPFKRVFSKKFAKKHYSQYLIALILPIGYLLFGLLSNNSKATGFIGRMLRPEQIAKVTSASYWGKIFTYAVTDNFATIGFTLMTIGFVICLFFIKREANRLLVVWALSIIPYAFIIGWMLEGHSYYQFPFMPVVAILISYALLFIANTAISAFNLTHNMKHILSISLVLLFFIIFMWPQFAEAKNRQFDTQFYGLDVAGEYLRKQSTKDEKVFGSGGQDTGFYWHAHRQGQELPEDLEKIQKLESQMNFRWVFLYQWGLQKAKKNPQVWSHITNNYQPRQIGLLEQGESAAFLYVLLEKGGSFNASNLQQYVNPRQMGQKTYELTRGNKKLLYANTR